MMFSEHSAAGLGTFELKDGFLVRVRLEVPVPGSLDRFGFCYDVAPCHSVWRSERNLISGNITANSLWEHAMCARRVERPINGH